MAGYPESDSELLSGCITGNKAAWDVFVERYSKLIYWNVRKTLEKTVFR